MATILIDPARGMDAPEITTPTTPDTNRRQLYPKSDGWYDQDDAGVEKGLAFADHNHGTDGVITKQSTADVSSPPTDAELDSAFGDPATLGDGFIAVLDDAGAATNSYLCWTASGAWFYAAGTKAT